MTELEPKEATIGIELESGEILDLNAEVFDARFDYDISSLFADSVRPLPPTEGFEFTASYEYEPGNLLDSLFPPRTIEIVTQRSGIIAALQRLFGRIFRAPLVFARGMIVILADVNDVQMQAEGMNLGLDNSEVMTMLEAIVAGKVNAEEILERLKGAVSE